MPFLTLGTQLWFVLSLDGSVSLVDTEAERLSPRLFIIRSPLGNPALLFKGFCSCLHSPVKIFCTRGCHVRTVWEPGNIKHLQGGEIRMRNGRTALSSAGSLRRVRGLLLSPLSAGEHWEWLVGFSIGILLIMPLGKELFFCYMFQKEINPADFEQSIVTGWAPTYFCLQRELLRGGRAGPVLGKTYSDG